MKIKLSIFLLLSYLTYSQTTTKNFNLVVQPKTELTITNYENNNFTPSVLLEDVVYLDGLGKTMQVISKQNNPDNKDIVSFVEYDEFGNQIKQYFPFNTNQNNLNFVSSAKTLQGQYYQTKYNDLYPFTETKLEKSPLKRNLKISNGGSIWKINSNDDNDKTLKFSHGVNVSNDKIINYSVDALGNINNSNYYQNSQLNKVISKNENWVSTDGNLNTIQSFTDKSGKSIANIKFYQENGVTYKTQTNFVYDIKGLLKYILTPNINNHEFGVTNGGGNKSWSFNKFLTTNASGGGSVNSSINNGLLTINFNAGFNSSTLKTGPIVYLDDRIPNTNLGSLSCSPSNLSYYCYIENGYLCIGFTQYPGNITNFSGTYTLNIDPTITFATDQDLLDKFAFQYKYDIYNRKIEQKSPGKDWEYNIFDNLDRPILTQDAKLKENNLWLFTKYDAFNRVIASGLYQNNSTRSQLQTQLDTYIANNVNNKSNIEKRSVISNQFGPISIDYTNNAFPNADIVEVHSLNYYDDYNFTDSNKPATPTSILNQTVTSYTKGLLTASWIKTVGDNDNSYTKSYNYYDTKGRLIYSYKKNYLDGFTSNEIEYDFRSKILKTNITHSKGLTASYRQTSNTKSNEENINISAKGPGNPPPPAYIVTTVQRRYEYDHAERLTAEFEKINTYPEERIAKYEYDELGNLVRKKIGGLTSSNLPLQTIDYTHNIRGWLTKINDPNALGTDLFAYEVKYNNPTSTSTPTYNGNISQVQWKSAISSTQLETYNYSYDKLNRLVDATYNSNGTNTLNFFEKIKYDKNDNISFLHRSGDVTNQSNLEWMDYMTYNYDGNKLTRIKEEGHGYFGFKTLIVPTDLTPQFEYDTNGNLTKDNNKNITLIKYNNLNLAEQVVFSSGKTINFKYDALGNKLAKKVVDGANITTTLYLDGFQYLNGILQFFPNSEGYALHNNGNFLHVYNYTDHLGNNRLSYCDVDNSGDINVNEIQSNIDFYPYGMSHAGEFTNSLVSNYLYKFQGKEFQNEGGIDVYDFGSRLYDPSVGRWFSQDPQNQFVSPYVAMGNNPILFYDPDGEVAIYDDIGVFLVGGIINVIIDYQTGRIESWEDAGISFAIGGVTGLAAYYSGPAAPVVAGLVGGSLNNAWDQYKRNKGFNNFDLTENGISSIKGGAIGGVTGGLGTAISGKFGSLFNRSDVAINPLFQDFLANSTASFTTSTIVGTGLGLADGNSFKESIGQGFEQGKYSFISNSVHYTGAKINQHFQNKQSSAISKPKTDQQKAQEEFKKTDESLRKTSENAKSFKNLTELGMKDGMKVTSSKALELAQEFLGKGYTEPVPGSGRYVSADGTRVFRMGESDITGAHGGGPHVNFETLIPNPVKPNKMMVDKNFHIFLID